MAHNYICSDCGGRLDIGAPVRLPPGLPPAREAHCPRCDAGKSFDGADRLVPDMDARRAREGKPGFTFADMDRAAAEKARAEEWARKDRLRTAARRVVEENSAGAGNYLRNYADTIGIDVTLPLTTLAERVLAATA